MRMIYMKRDKIVVSMSHMVITLQLLLCSALVINCNYAEEDYLDMNAIPDDDDTTLADQGKENLSKYLINRIKQRVNPEFHQQNDDIDDDVLPMLRKCLHVYDLIQARYQPYAGKTKIPNTFQKDKRSDQQEYTMSDLAYAISRMKQRNGVKLPVLRFGGFGGKK